MKKVLNDRIVNIKDTDLFDNKFLFTFLKTDFKNPDIEVFDMWKLLLERQNTELLNNIWDKYAMFSNVYNEKDELEFFEKLFDYAISNNKKIHIIWVTLDEEIKKTVGIVNSALKEKGYKPINQIVGYLISNDPAYISSHDGARKVIQQVTRDEIIEELVKSYLKK